MKDGENTGGAFETKQPTLYNKQGVNLRDLLRFASGKGEGEQLTADDFGKVLKGAGVSGKQARHLTKAFDTITKNENLDYVLSEKGDSFNVFDKTTGEALTRSSRKTGSTKGLTIADVLKLGDNVSELAGFASNKIGDYLKPKAAVQEKEAPKVPLTTTPSTTTVQNVQAPGKTGGKGKGPAKPAAKPSEAYSKTLSDLSGLYKDFRVKVDDPNYPKVDLPTVTKPSPEQQAKIDAIDAKKIQQQYSSHIKTNYPQLFQYIVGDESKMSNSDKIAVAGSIRTLRSKQPAMHDYLMKYHKDKISKIASPNLNINGSY